jgi:hypothetical protein
MKTQKISRALKAAAEYFMTGAGLVSLVIGFVALAIFIPPFVSVPIILVVGGVCAIVGGRRKWTQLKEREARQVILDLQRQEVKVKHEETLVLSRNLDKRMIEIAEAERKIQLKLEEHMELEQKHEMEHKQARERQQLDCQRVESGRERAPETPGAYPPMTASQPRHSQGSHRPQVTIRISNLPTFFMVNNASGRNSPANLAEAHPEPGTDTRSRSHVYP